MKKLNEIKRVTVIERRILVRERGNNFKESSETYVYYNKTDKTIKEEIENLNKNKKSRFFEIKGDYNISTEKGKRELLSDTIKYYKDYFYKSCYYHVINYGSIKDFIENEKNLYNKYHGGEN